MDPVLLDTDILSELLRAKNPRVVGNGERYLRQFDHYTISAVTVVELVRGFHKAGRQAQVAELAASLFMQQVLPLDQEAAFIAGAIYGELQRTGQTIGRADPLIAGIAISNKLTLVTGNGRHFERIVTLGFQLPLIDWRQ